MAIRLILATERVDVRELAWSDLERLHTITSDPDVARYVDDFEPYTLDKTRELLRRALESYEDTPFGPWAFVQRATTTMVGFGGVETLPGRDIPEITFILAKEYWGRGLASEIARGCLDYARSSLACERVGASVDPRNHASIRVIEKLGMKRVRTGTDELGLPAVFYERRD